MTVLRRDAAGGRRAARVAQGLVVLAIASAPARSYTQQPFIVDDAEVTRRGGVHVEVSDQVNRLRPSAWPARWQNTFDPEVDVGLPGRLELGVTVPAISLLRDRTIGDGAIHGIGDTTLAIKWRMTPAPDATLCGRRVPSSACRRDRSSADSDPRWWTMGSTS